MNAPAVVRTEIIPDRVTIVSISTSTDLDLKAICIFAATGFFLEADTYFCGQRALQPSTEYAVGAGGQIERAQPYWSWHYTPRDVSLSQATDEFCHLFERITREQTSGRHVILPLSGGLDSRTQAAALRDVRDVHAYSYAFDGSFDETTYGRQVAHVLHYGFRSLTIPRGYLWREIDELAGLNACYSEFTHPRQMAVIDEVATLGDLFFLGHWGDVLFDDMGVRADLAFDMQVKAIIAKIIKKGGLELATALWQAWGIEGTFEGYLIERVATLMAAIKIDDANARIRAFKSMYWAPRWTSVNLIPFSSRHQIALPYYHPEMCRFVCTIPERHLAARQIQIEYIKRCTPALARIPWQSYHPLNLYTYKSYYSRRMVPYRAAQRARRIFREKILGKRHVIRNWEIQFLGKDNDARLRGRLFDTEAFRQLVPSELVTRFYKKFTTEDAVRYSHPVSTLLTLSLFASTSRERPSL